jgi:hypothetical protein
VAKTKKLSAAIFARATNTRHGSLPWYRLLPADVVAELEQLRVDWESGKTGLQKRAMARAIRAEMQSRGLPVCGIQGVEGWLDREGKP